MTLLNLDRTPSRRRVLCDAAALAAGGFFLTTAARAAAAKSTQKAVDYQHHPKAGHGCNSCKDFQPPAACKSVESPIEAGGWCNKYVHS